MSSTSEKLPLFCKKYIGVEIERETGIRWMIYEDNSGYHWKMKESVWMMELDIVRKSNYRDEVIVKCLAKKARDEEIKKASSITPEEIQLRVEKSLKERRTTNISPPCKQVYNVNKQLRYRMRSPVPIIDPITRIGL
jgi:hypothetical protein